jgi:hypothetical protein
MGTLSAHPIPISVPSLRRRNSKSSDCKLVSHWTKPDLLPQGVGEGTETLLLCRDALLKDRKRLRIDLSDIKSFDQELGLLLGDDPTQYLPLVGLLLSDPYGNRLASFPASGGPQICKWRSTDLQVAVHRSASGGPQICH